MQAAEKAANFVLTKLRDDTGRLKRTYSGGEARLNAYLNDYAFLVDGLLRLHQATGDKRWLDAADSLTQKQIELFADPAGGGFFFTSSDHEALLGPWQGDRRFGHPRRQLGRRRQPDPPRRGAQQARLPQPSFQNGPRLRCHSAEFPLRRPAHGHGDSGIGGSTKEVGGCAGEG